MPPKTAAIGETLAACLAGDRAASKTVAVPTNAPLTNPVELK